MRRRYYLFLTICVLIIGFMAGAASVRWMEPSPALAQMSRNDRTKNAPITVEWEEMGTNIKRNLYRAKVPGGWLVAQQNGLAFIPDPQYKW